MPAHSIEAGIAASLSHPGLVQTYKHSIRKKPLQSLEQQDEEKVPRSLEGLSQCMETWIVQEYCDRGTLQQHCKEPRLEGSAVAEVVQIVLEVSSAAAYLHSRGIIHSDLTANNVLLKSDNSSKGYTCKVCDFGLARILEKDAEEVRTHSLGTVNYMAPELVSATDEVVCLTPKADVYSLGIILWQVCAGSIPFARLPAPHVALQVARGQRPQMPQAAIPELTSLYNQCVAQDMQDRPTMDKVVELLVDLLATLKRARGPPEGTTSAGQSKGIRSRQMTCP